MGTAATSNLAALARPADGNNWPSPGSVECRWLSDSDLVGGRHRGPFQIYPSVPAEIADADLTWSSHLAAKIAEAAADVSRLNARNDLEPAVLESPLLRSESVGSSQIEGLRVSERRVAAALAGVDNEAGAAREVANNVDAMREAIRIASDPARRLDTSMLLDVHRRLLTNTAMHRYAGELRRVQNWLGRSDKSPKNADYIPPPPELVAPLLDDLALFLERDDIPPIAHAAIAHAQFEGIHPFVDGNGRTGRALVHAVLRRSSLAPRLAPPISVILLGRRDEYFAALNAYQADGNPYPIIESFADAATEASIAAERLAAQLDELRDEWDALPGRPRAGSIGRRILDDLTELPVLNADTVAERHGVVPDVARRGLAALTDIGILRETSGRKRGRIWVADAITDLLDAFGADTARDAGNGRRVGPSRHLRTR